MIPRSWKKARINHAVHHVYFMQVSHLAITSLWPALWTLEVIDQESKIKTNLAEPLEIQNKHKKTKRSADYLPTTCVCVLQASHTPSDSFVLVLCSW